MVPKNKLFLITLMCLFYLVSPLVEWINYKTDLLNGTYDVNYDSIGLPFGLYLIAWLLGLPLLLILLWFVWKRYPGRISFLYFNSERPYWSLVCSLIAVFLISWNLFFIFEQTNEANTLNIFYTVFEVYLILCLRSVLIFQKRKFWR
jgi:glucan phosphoethanolaminetransferase (alkaline phosphatase superfamily)